MHDHLNNVNQSAGAGQNSQSAPGAPGPSKKSFPFLITAILAVLALTVLGAAGIFAYLKYFNSQNSNVGINAASNQNVNTNSNIGNGSGNNNSAESLAEKLAMQTGVNKFNNYEEIQAFLKENSYDARSSYSFAKSTLFNEMNQKVESELALPSFAGLGGTGDTIDYSSTNIQVQGVDESDLIKTDGSYIYALSGNAVYISKAYPIPESGVISKIELPNYPQGLYLNGNHLAVYGVDYGGMMLGALTEKFSKLISRSSANTFFNIYDISDPSRPELVKELLFEGGYSNSRMIGEYIYFVTMDYSGHYLDQEMPVPYILSDGKMLYGESATMPDIYYFNIPYSEYNYMNISSINIKELTLPLQSEIYLLSENQNMYVSPENIYITYTRRISEEQIEMEIVKELLIPRMNGEYRKMIADIMEAESHLLNFYEKSRKIEEVLERYYNTLALEEQKLLKEEIEKAIMNKYASLANELEKTIIHKIAINKGEISYQRQGEVVGEVLNQFSMDEKDGYFRIATTKGSSWSSLDSDASKIFNNMYVLDQNLKIVGRVEGIAPDERIYSVRFMGNRAYMVTFQQIDPLFSLDLSDPTNPKILGELKIPGYSTYLHPYSDELLIGFGQETELNEWGGVSMMGLKLSLFDVSDISNPKEINTYVMGGPGSYSYALHDHRAFLFSKEKNLLVIPVSIYDYAKQNNESFTGAYVFDVDESGFRQKGKISHDNDVGRRGEIEEGQWPLTLKEESDFIAYDYQSEIKRSLYIENELYTYSDIGLRINNLDNLDLSKYLWFK